MTSTYSKVIADSISPSDIRLTTLECYYPLMIHAQAKTHRILSLDDECYIETNYSVGLMDDPMLSRNAQSNRAMPVAKMLEQVINNPAMPSHWGKNQAGMQASDEEVQWIKHYPPNEHHSENLSPREFWGKAGYSAFRFSNEASEAGLHKQIANRLTMPFQYIKVIVSATEWKNFFKLRLHDADPTMMELSSKMKEAMDNSTPKLLQPGEWHLPYVTKEENDEMLDLDYELLKKCSVARCARVSYNNHDNSNPDIEKDLALADRLLKDGHLSPFEHIASPMEQAGVEFMEDCMGGVWEKGITHMDRDEKYWSGNLKGWVQYRQLL